MATKGYAGFGGRAVTSRCGNVALQAIPVTTAGAPLLSHTVRPHFPARQYNRTMRRPTFLLLATLCIGAVAQQTDALYDEAKVPRYTLPPVLTLKSGQPA